MRDRSKSIDLINSFRNARNQVQKAELNQKTSLKKGFPSNKNQLASFEEKYANLSKETFERFTAVDLVYYFRRISEQAGKRYVISNIRKDAGMFKRAMKSYSQLEIALMIEFLFSPEQTYIEVPSPGVIASGWCNTVFNDAQKWAKGEPISVKKKKTPEREWTEEDQEIKVGEW